MESKQEQEDKIGQFLEEAAKCTSDVFYFITHYCRDYTMPGYPRITKLHKKQEQIINTFLTDHYVIINGSRQTGKTFSVIALFSWLIYFHGNYKTAVLSKKAQSTYILVKEMKDFLSVVDPPFTTIFPARLRSGSSVSTIKSLEGHFILKNDSEVIGITIPADTPEEAGRGLRQGAIFVDEIAYLKNTEEVMSGIEQTTNRVFLNYEKRNYPYGIVLASTPNGITGVGKWYYQQWTAALSDRTKYKPVRFHWTEVSEYTEEWFKKVTKGKNPRTIAQEYDLVFLGSNTSFFEDETIRVLQDESIDIEPKRIMINNLKVDIYEEYDPNKFYLIGVDSATLHGGDMSSIEVIDFMTGEQVAEFVGKCRVEDLCILLSELVKLYPSCNIVPEANGLGNQVIEYVTSQPNLRYITFKQPIKNVNTNTTAYKYGLTLNKDNRSLLLEEVYTKVKEEPHLIKSRALKLQLIGLEIKGDRIEGQPDDAVFALGFTYLVRAKYPNRITRITGQEQIEMREVNTLFNDRYNMNEDDTTYINPLEKPELRNPLFDKFSSIFLKEGQK